MAVIDRLFVYGTLRRNSGHPMQATLSRYAEHLCSGRICGRMYDLGGYPGVTLSDMPAHVVYGDVYRLKDAGVILPILDRYEGCGDEWARPQEFGRYRVDVLQHDGGRCEAWVYLYELDTESLHVIPGGDFIRHLDADGMPGTKRFAK